MRAARRSPAAPRRERSRPSPPPPPLGPTDAPRLRPPPAAMSRGSWRRLERAAARRGRRSGAEGRAPVSGAGGPSVGRGGRRGAAGPAQRWEGPRRGRPGPVHRGGAAGCGAARSVCRPPRPGPGARLPAPRGPSRFVSGVFGFVCSRCARFLVKTSHSVRICIPSPIPFGFGANRYDWGRSFPSVSAPRLGNGLTQSKRRPPAYHLEEYAFLRRIQTRVRAPARTHWGLSGGAARAVGTALSATQAGG